MKKIYGKATGSLDFTTHQLNTSLKRKFRSTGNPRRIQDPIEYAGVFFVKIVFFDKRAPLQMFDRALNMPVKFPCNDNQ